MSTTDVPLVRYDVVDTGVVGPLLVRVNDADEVCGVTFLEPAGGFPVSVRSLLPPGGAALRDAGAVAPVGEALLAYLHGETRRVAVAYTLGAEDGFRRAVQGQLSRIPHGEVWTYGTLAAEAGNERAMRAAASACARNPVPLIVPCHRVVPATGGTGRYVGGHAFKNLLLKLEGVDLARF